MTEIALKILFHPQSFHKDGGLLPADNTYPLGPNAEYTYIPSVTSSLFSGFQTFRKKNGTEGFLLVFLMEP